MPGGGSRAQQCGGVRDTIDRADTASLVTSIGAGVLTAASVTLFILDASGDEPERAPATAGWSCGGGPGWVGVTCRLVH